MSSPSAAPGPAGRADVGVRRAVPGDAAAIAHLQGVTWAAAYRDVLPGAVLDTWDDDAVAQAWRSAVTDPPTPEHAVVVALEGRAVVGVAASGPVGPEDGEPAPGPSFELSTLLVEPRWGRRGHGRRLVAAVVALARRAGAAGLVCWVTEPDEVTARFLARTGWAPDGWARTLDADTTTIRQLRWRLPLARDGSDPEEGAP